MKQARRHSLLIVVAAGVLAWHGCVQEQGALFVSGALPVNPNDACVADPNGQVYQGSGLLDLGEDASTVPNDYTIALEVTTNLPSTFSTQDVARGRTESPNYPDYGNTDSNVIFFDAVEVYFVDEDGEDINQLPTAGAVRESTVGGSLYNEQTTLNAQAAVFAPLLTSVEAQRLAGIGLTAPLINNFAARANITARVRIKGRTTGGARVRSPEFAFPLELCRGCLYRFGADQNGDCPAGTTLQPTAHCFTGQDYPVAACLP